MLQTKTVLSFITMENKTSSQNPRKRSNKAKRKITDEVRNAINQDIDDYSNLARWRGNLRVSIANIVEILDCDRVLYNDDKLDMTNDLVQFVEDSITKFIKGQKEHGGKLIDRNLSKDIAQEIMEDLLRDVDKSNVYIDDVGVFK